MIDARIPLMHQGIDMGAIMRDAQQSKMNNLQMQQMQQEGERKNRLADLLPRVAQGDADARQELIGVDFDAWSKMDKAHRESLETHREKILLGAKIIRQMNPQDEAGWQQARQAAQMAGIDLSDVPQNFDPSYVQGLTSIADALDARKPEYRALEPGGSLIDVSGGQPRIVIAPNDGSQPVGAPVQGGPAPGMVEDGFRFRGGNPADPNNWEPVNGGPTPQASGTFQP